MSGLDFKVISSVCGIEKVKIILEKYKGKSELFFFLQTSCKLINISQLGYETDIIFDLSYRTFGKTLS